MSLQKAQLWLKNHSDSIPALRVNHQQIIEKIESESSSQDINSNLLLDPGLSLAILKKINTGRGSSTSKDSVDSAIAAASLLGNKVTHELIKKSEVAEIKLNRPHQLFLFLQIANRSLHNKLQVSEWAKKNGYQHIEQLTSAALLHYCGEFLCCVYDYENYLKFIISGSLESDEKKYFDFSFPQLTEALCLQLNLSSLITHSQSQPRVENQRENLLYYIATLCQQSEHGWSRNVILDTFQQFADFLQLPLDQVSSDFHQISVLAARQSIIPEAWQPASRLILISDQAWTPPMKQKVHAVKGPTDTLNKSTSVRKPAPKATSEQSPVTQNETSTEEKTDVISHLKQLIKKPEVSQTEILNTCLQGIVSDISMSRVSLLLLSKDKKKLQNRISLGYEKEAPFRKYQIELSHSGLLKAILKKPQSIWINDSNLKKYERLIPESLLTNIKTSSFVAMSLFIGEKPVGIIYADRYTSARDIDEQSFTQFKQLILLTSKTLKYLSGN